MIERRLRVEPEWSQGAYYIVRDLDTRRVVAQGSYDMCERIAAGLPALESTGDLFHDTL